MRSPVIVLALLLTQPAAVRAQQKLPAPVGIEEAAAWVKQRVRLAKQGKPELVRIPIAFASMGWGCRCPDRYIGTTSNSAEGPWLSLSGASVGLPYKYSERLGTVAVAEGHFTGRRVKQDLREGKDDPQEWLYHPFEFTALRFRRFRDTREADAKLHVLLDGAEAARKVPPFKDGKRWLVITNSVPLRDKRSARRAEQLRAKLLKQGFTAAEVFDGRAAPLLSCCYRVVVAGRYATKEEARAAAKQARKKRLRGVYVKQGW